MRRKNFETPMPMGNAVTYERKGITSEIVIPLLACVLFGLGVTVSLVVVQWGILDIEGRDALKFGGGVGVLAASLAVTWRFFKAVVWIAEEATRRDLDRDGWVGEPEPRIITVRGGQPSPVEDKKERVREELANFVRGCEVDTSMRRWEPLLGRERYLLFRQALLETGHAAWVSDDRRQGWALTAPAEEIVSQFN